MTMLMVMWMKMCFMFRMMIAERSWAMFLDRLY